VTDPWGLENTVIDSRYILRERLGAGAFGAVYRAEQRILQVPVRRVAVKLSKQDGVTREAAEDQLGEALALARAMDEMTDAAARMHLVQLYDGGVTTSLGGRSFLVMEYIQGTTLATQFGSYQRMPARLLLRWAREICVALRGLHALVPPMLHRDLKPDNVLLSLDRTVRLVDFGLAARLVERGYLPGVAGTLTYMAPETMRGESVPASDVYSLGLLLYEGLTGRQPYDHLNPPIGLPDDLHREWLYDARCGCRVDPPSLRNNTVPAALDDVILSCLRTEPSRRPRAAELCELLDADRHSAQAPEAPLDEARRLHAEGDTAGAARILDRALSAAPGTARARFDLLVALGGILAARDDPASAAQRYAEAWRLVAAGEIALGGSERAALLQQAATAYEQAGNAYQATRFHGLRGGGPDGGRR